MPWPRLYVPLLMVGGAFLCFEGFEKIAHRLLHSKSEDLAHRDRLGLALADPAADLVAFERDKIQGAVRTDFILSAEIVAITLGTVGDQPFATQLGVLSAIAVAMTVGVYGLVASIVKLDDAGLALSRRGGGLAGLGRGILAAAPWLMKTLSVVGTAAMFLVVGGILVHGAAPLHHAIEAALAALPAAARLAAGTLAEGLVGVAAGAVLVGAWVAGRRLLGRG